MAILIGTISVILLTMKRYYYVAALWEILSGVMD